MLSKPEHCRYQLSPVIPSDGYRIHVVFQGNEPTARSRAISEQNGGVKTDRRRPKQTPPVQVLPGTPLAGQRSSIRRISSSARLIDSMGAVCLAGCDPPSNVRRAGELLDSGSVTYYICSR
jgi:hypothetical protein